MAEEKESGERTEEATPQKREEFRKQGQVAYSREVGTAFMLFGASALMWLMSSYFYNEVQTIFRTMLGEFPATLGKSGDLVKSLHFAGFHVVTMLGPVFLILGVIAFLSTVLQIGFLTNSDVISPNIERINPISGLQKIFSLRSLIEGFKAVIKVSLVAFITFSIVKTDFLKSPHLLNSSVEQLIKFFGQTTLHVIFGVALFMIVIAVLDYGYQRWDLEKKMMMTKEEVKEEVKTREGNPQIKARIRRIQREMASKRMMESVPKADVIITNPTHIAIALKYDANLPAPQVIAKGADRIAEKIKEIARNAGVPIVENKPLARTMFKTMKIGQVIPRELFNAVAEVLAYVYKLKKKVVR